MATVEDYTKFKLVTDFRDSLIISEIETNLKMWLDWCLLGIGAWNDVAIPTESSYGDFHALRVVDDDAYNQGQVWEGVRKDWVWETGVAFDDAGNNPEPTLITGVIVDGVGQSGDYHVNYPLGRIIFDTAISTTSDVQVVHSYRYVQTYRADDVPWFRELQFASLQPGDGMFAQTDKGDWTIGGQHRVQMPTIIIEGVSRGDTEGYEMGNGALNIRQDVLFHILAENRADRNSLLDICRCQVDKSIWLFNSNTIAESGAFPLDYRGSLVGSNMYPDLVAETGYRWRICRFTNNHISEIAAIHTDLYEGVVRSTLETVIGEI